MPSPVLLESATCTECTDASLSTVGVRLEDSCAFDSLHVSRAFEPFSVA